MKIIPPCEAELKDSGLIGRTVLCDGLNAFPGLIDQHIHITGGGGEHGFSEHVTEIHIYDIINAGVSTVAGLLGADGVTRSLEALFAKAKTLEELGLSTYIYSGSYAMPPVSFTGSVLRDIILIDKVIGAGEIAISDHRSSQPDLPDMMKLASEVHLGGMISGKAGVLHIHVGDGKKGLEPLVKILDESDLPIGMFVPTHLNRNPELFRQATEYCRSGGNIDLTAGEKAGLP
ncbi:MAG: amidohydrolase family protein, partial [Bacillota bacterium]|nr:amidohydrolase family protein [Bacillota bacterium]